MKDTYNDGYKTEDIKCIVVDFIAEDGKGGFPIMRQGTYVLCKDCKYWQTSKIKGGIGYHTCMCVRFGKEGIIAFADDFCSRGVKK